MKLKLWFAFTLSFVSSMAFALTSTERGMNHYVDSIKTEHQKLEALLHLMPKGGDLHIHPSGATYAENMISYALGDGLCIDSQSYLVSENPSCKAADLLDNAVKDDAFYNRLIDAWSMRNFQAGTESSHDHFFAAYYKFVLIVIKHRAEVLAEIVQRAASQNESYVEIMTSESGNDSGRLGKQLGWDADFDKMREKLWAQDFDKIVKTIINSVGQEDKKMRTILACDSNQAQAACSVEVRYLYQILREQPPEMVFAQLLAGFEVASQYKKVVGLNLVMPEDGPVAMRDYKLQMEMIGYFRKLYPKVPISLHAGELSNAVVPPEALTSHINDAVTLANANRIGHGVDIAEENNHEQLLKDMAERGILVEINLSSNFSILDLEGHNHPLPLYMQFGVPVALSTDDEGISRSNLSNEYVMAVENFNLNYSSLKTMARNSLAYSFLPGQALWTDHAYQAIAYPCKNDTLGSEQVSASCRAFLDGNEKASIQWDLERRFSGFESAIMPVGKSLP